MAGDMLANMLRQQARPKIVAAATGLYHVFAIAKTWQALLPVVLLFQARITLRQVLNYFHEWFVAGRAYR